MGRKESAGTETGAARMTVGDRFWARRIRPIFDDGDLTLEQKSVFCCIVARDPMSVAIECPARDIAAAEAGLPRRDYDEALAALKQKYVSEFWGKPDAGHTAVRFCTGWSTRDEDIDALLSTIRAL